MSNIKQIKPCAHIPTALRNIADNIEDGEYKVDNITLVGGDMIFHCGTVCDAQAAAEAMWNLNYGIHKLLRAGDDE